MENNKSQFKRTGVLHGGAECIEIQISQAIRLSCVAQSNAGTLYSSK